MNLNEKGLQLIKSFEGLKLQAYRCPANVLTIGYGTTVYPDGTRVRPTDSISAARADELLIWDLENRYCPHVREANIYPHLKNDNEFSALVSFVYNVGRGGLHAPNSINRRIANGENYRAVVESELTRWNRGGGRVLAGLVRRRNAEIELFNTPVAAQDIEIHFGEVGGPTAQYQKALNVWLARWNKTLLTTDGIFGALTLTASNDFARNNKEPEFTNGVGIGTYNKVMAFAKSQETDKPKYDQPDIIVYARGADIQLSHNFHLREFTCKCGRCRDQLVSQQMIRLLEQLRSRMGVPLFINSAYRCATHNRNVGGATNSRHMVGDAVDILIFNLNWRELVREARAVGFRGIGLGARKGFIHVDLGDVREWSY